MSDPNGGYGMAFASMYTGSMYGAGPVVFAVWGYVIATGRAGRVDLNPRLLAATIGTTEEEIRSAIARLCSPDPESRNPEEDGRRLVKEGTFLYRVVSWDRYRDRKAQLVKREFDRAHRPSGGARARERAEGWPVRESVEEALTDAALSGVGVMRVTPAGPMESEPVRTSPSPVRSSPSGVRQTKAESEAEAETKSEPPPTPRAPRVAKTDRPRGGVGDRDSSPEAERAAREPAPVVTHPEHSPAEDARRLWAELWRERWGDEYTFQPALGPGTEHEILHRLGARSVAWAAEQAGRSEEAWLTWVMGRYLLEEHPKVVDERHPLAWVERRLNKYGNPPEEKTSCRKTGSA